MKLYENIYSAATVARYILEILNLEKNGSIWIIDNSEKREVELHQF